MVVSNGKGRLRDMSQKCLDSFHWGEKIVIEAQDVEYDCLTIKQPVPFNYNQCLNLGLKHCTDEYVCFSNNDVSFLDDFGDITTYNYDSMSPKNPIWGRHKDLEGVIEGYDIGLHLCGWCIVAKREMIERIGGFPEDVDFWCSDNLYADVLIYHNIKHALITSCNAIHYPSTTLYQSPDIKELTHGQAEKYKQAKKKWIL